MKKNSFTPDPLLDKALNNYQPDFTPFFETRLMAKIAALSENSYSALFGKAFQRIIFSGIAAVAILLITIYISEGTISTDALLGTSQLDLESLTAMTISNL